MHTKLFFCNRNVNTKKVGIKEGCENNGLLYLTHVYVITAFSFSSKMKGPII